MGSFANSMFSVLLGWVRGAVNWLWGLFSSEESGGLTAWLGEHWLGLADALCVVGMLADLVVYMVRWRPYKVWASFFRRLFGRNKRQEEPAPRRHVRREWVYPDGTARAEEPEEAPEEERPEPETMPHGRVSSADMEERYVMSFAPPEEYRQRAAQPAQLKYQQELDNQQPVPGLEDYPKPREIPAESEQTQSSEPSGRINRRMLRLNAQRFLNRDEDELQLRYTPAPPPVDKNEAYRAPYVPPQWKKPANVGASVRGEENAHDTAL